MKTPIRFNRTFMELKAISYFCCISSLAASFNRTFMELKVVSFRSLMICL